MNKRLDQTLDSLERLDTRLARLQRNILTRRDFRTAVLMSSMVSGFGLTVVSVLVLWVAGVFGG